MSQRLYLPQVPAPGEQSTLDKDQSHYLLRVLRLSTGAELRCFDGRGSQWQVRIVSTEGRRAIIEGLSLDRQVEPPTELILAQSWLKGAAMDTVVQKATELGATRIAPLITDRTNVHLKGSRLEQRLTHLQRVAISASEQCGSLFVPQVMLPQTPAALLDSVDPSLHRLMLDLQQPALSVADSPEPLLLMIGPEGGWSDPERALAVRAGVTLCGLGELTLRAETVPLVALAAIRQSWGWQR